MNGMERTERNSWHLEVDAEQVGACDALAATSGLSKARIKDAMNKGAVWLQPKRGSPKRLRRASTQLMRGDRIALHYDPQLLGRMPDQAQLVADRKRYSVWDKPAGMMSQGNEYGDHCSLLRSVELRFRPQRQVFLVHRLDREASGLVLLAHDKAAAARLSERFRTQQVDKHYRVQVLGDLSDPGSGVIASPLDGKPALTHYRCMAYDAAQGMSELSVTIETGRRHQIRRHLDSVGHPVMGDPRYGQGNKNTTGMRLRAVELGFLCPFTGDEQRFFVDVCAGKEEHT